MLTAKCLSQIFVILLDDKADPDVCRWQVYINHVLVSSLSTLWMYKERLDCWSVIKFTFKIVTLQNKQCNFFLVGTWMSPGNLPSFGRKLEVNAHYFKKEKSTVARYILVHVHTMWLLLMPSRWSAATFSIWKGQSGSQLSVSLYRSRVCCFAASLLLVTLASCQFPVLCWRLQYKTIGAYVNMGLVSSQYECIGWYVMFHCLMLFVFHRQNPMPDFKHIWFCFVFYTFFFWAVEL